MLNQSILTCMICAADYCQEHRTSEPRIIYLCCQHHGLSNMPVRRNHYNSIAYTHESKEQRAFFTAATFRGFTHAGRCIWFLWICSVDNRGTCCKNSGSWKKAKNEGKVDDYICVLVGWYSVTKWWYCEVSANKEL